jgi:uncharacterized protein (DUF1330 family)
MKPIYQLIIAGVAGMLIGAAATGTLLAQPAPAQAYFIANLTDIHDPAAFKTYQEKAGPTSGPYGGKPLVRGTPAMALDNQTGDWATPPKGMVAVIAFPSMERLKAWWDSPEYSAVRPIREHAATGKIYAVEGVPPS